MPGPGTPISHRQFAERLVIALLVIGTALILWQLRSLLILVFGAAIVAVILTVIARPFHERLRLPSGAALLVAVLILVALFGTAFWLFGAQVVAQANALQARIPEAWKLVEERFAAWGLGDSLEQWTRSIQSGSGVSSNLGGIAMSVGSAVADTLLVLVGGIYIAAKPDFYRSGILKMVPKNGRAVAAEALDDTGRALRLWLFGQFASMVIVGLLTGIGLWVLGVPSASTLGLLAGILEFVPFIGPIVSAFPAVILALAIDPQTALWVVLLYVIVQQIEGNIVQPLVQQRAVEMPPALLLFSIVAGGLVFGVVGIIFAAPLTVVIYVLVKRLYVREALHTETKIPGEKEGK